MPPTVDELRDQLATVADPQNDDDIVSMGLVRDVTVEDGTAVINLAFNAPFAPTEIEIGNEIRDVVETAGLEPDLRAQAGEDLGFDESILPGVRNVIAVASGKGGVGKTTVATNLAAGLDDLGARVGILDADVHGPNVPRILPPENKPGVTPNDEIVPPQSGGVSVMSTEMLLPDGDEPAILRGPMVNNVMMKFIEDVKWDQLDYLIVDLPPGTGDASLNLLQSLPVTGVVIVTTPQEMALDDARKGLGLFEQHEVPILGIVENMSSFKCPGCGDQHELFGTSDIAGDFDAPIIAKLPAHPSFDSERSEGPVVREDESAVQENLVELVESVADGVGEVNRRRVAEQAEPDQADPDETEAR